MHKVLTAALVAAFAVAGAAAGSAVAADNCYYRDTPAGRVFYCVTRTPVSENGCEVNVGRCDGYCFVNVGYCAPGGNCVINVGACGGGDDALLRL
jgi:hypothetical protein